MIDIRKIIRVVPDFPKQGINFFDITTVLQEAAAFQQVIDTMCSRFTHISIDNIAGVEARGFVYAAALAYKMNKGVILIRKQGKLPAETIRQEYELEYATDAVEMHRDAVKPGEKILVVDDLLATGGTVGASCRLIEQAEGEVAGIAFMVELDFLNGRDKLRKYDVFSIVHIKEE